MIEAGVGGTSRSRFLLLTSLASQLDPAICAIVTDFLENREYALALEWLAEAASIQGIQISEAQQAERDRLAKLMGIDLG
ncbi:MAG TPA: hypothetical protein VMM15_29330 [Bradyrhizobium sp.]|nr:hypothetical protein [Bradyrhizobium sp.]